VRLFKWVEFQSGDSSEVAALSLSMRSSLVQAVESAYGFFELVMQIDSMLFFF